MIKLPESPAVFAGAVWSDVLPYYDQLASRSVTKETAAEWLQDWSEFEDLVGEARESAYFAYTCDTADEAKEAANLRFQTEIEPQAAEQRVRLARLLVESGYERPDLLEPLRAFRTDIELFREENVELKAEVERLSTEYQKVTGGLVADWNGEELPLPRLRPFMADPDRSIREKAWRLERQQYIGQREILARIFTDQYRLRQKIARNAGFKNFRDYQHQVFHRFDYTPDDCYRFHEAVLEKTVPAAKRIYERHLQKLGLESLRPWDVEVDPDGRPALKPFSTNQEFIDRGRAIFQQLDPVLGARFDTLANEDLLDLESRKGKAPGGYMTELPHRKRPLIFMNAAGVAGDVHTLVHEAGHCFHGFEYFEAGRLFCQRMPGMEMGEVGSMAMELLSAPYWGRQSGGYYSEEDYRRARIDHLEGIVLFFPHCATVDALQHWIYTDPAGEDAGARDDQWLRLRRQFEIGVDYTGLTEEWVARWYRQLHFWEVPFYYIEYGIAQLGALQIWRNARRDQQAAVSAYRRALALGSTRPLPELYRAADIKLAFDAATIGELVELVEEELAALQA